MSPHKFETRTLEYLLCLLSLMALMGCTPTPRSNPRSNHFGIIFANVDFYRIADSTQGEVEQLTFTPTILEYYPLVSNNGDKIIFVAEDNRLLSPSTEQALEIPKHMYILDTASRKLQDVTSILTGPPQVNRPTTIEDWSPDEKQFVYINAEEGVGIMNVDGTNRKEVPMPSLGGNLFIGLVRWSPDGKKLVMNNSVFEPGIPLVHVGEQLLVYDLGNGKLTQIADKDQYCLDARWSPTSQQVAATCSPNAPKANEITDPSLIPSSVRIYDINQPGQPYGSSPFSICSDPSWAPDGKQLTFVCDTDKNHKGLFVENSDGNDLHEVKLGSLGNPAVLKNPIWSPDGKQIIYVAGVGYKNTNIYSVHLDGSGNHALTIQEAFYSLISVYPVP